MPQSLLNSSNDMRTSQAARWFKRLLLAVVIIELVYLVLFNLALNINLTQKIINSIRPEKFQVNWQNAWTWYPFRVSADGVRVSGQTQSQFWKVEVDEATASISLLALVRRHVDLYRIRGVNAAYYQRPRISKEKPFENTAAYFAPLVEAQKTAGPALEKKPKKQSSAWTITLDDIVAEGNHTLWIYQVKAILSGKVQTDLSLQTRGGPFEISQGIVDINLEKLLINGDHEVLKQARIEGRLDIAPIIFKENRGIDALEFISLDADINAELGSLAFLNLYLNEFHGMQVNGNGHVDGQLRFDRGTLLAATRLDIDAKKLQLSLLEHKVEGDGNVQLNVAAEKPEELAIALSFAQLAAFHERIEEPLFQGSGLSVEARGRPSLFPRQLPGSGINYLGVKIPSVKVVDLAVYQHYLPPQWRFNIYGGEGLLEGKAALTRSDFNADLKITSTEAELGIDDSRFKTDLDFGFLVNSSSLQEAKVDISGSYLKLDDQRLSTAEKGKSKPWQTSLMIEKGTLKLHLPDAEQPTAASGSQLAELSHALKAQDLKQLLAAAEAELVFKGNVSRLDWLNVLMKNSLNLRISGSGDIAANIQILSGWPATGSQVDIQSNSLEISIIDYLFSGNGRMQFSVDKGGPNPDVGFALAINNGLFKRHDEEQAFVEDVMVKLSGSGKNMGFKGPDKNIELRLQIPSATVKDMTTYNYYLPQQSPLLFSRGTADLKADIELKPENASGYVNLTTKDLQGQFDEQTLDAELTVDVKLSNGIPRDMKFDISGSSILLDKVKVAGVTEDFEQKDWRAKIDLTTAETVWRKPVSLHTDADIAIRDSRPVVALMSNQREKHGWLEKLLTIEDIQGVMQLDIKNNQMVIPYSFIDSDKISLGAKGFISKDHREGIFYVRFKALKALLKTRNGERNLDILKVQQTFNQYDPSTQLNAKPVESSGDD